jgi:hypothetical protein
VPFGGLGGEQVRGLGHQLGFEVARLGAERPDHLHIQTAGPERGVGDVDDLVPGGVQPGDRGPHGHRLPRADITCDHAGQDLVDAEADPRGGLGVSLAGEQVPGGDRFPERCAARILRYIA